MLYNFLICFQVDQNFKNILLSEILHSISNDKIIDLFASAKLHRIFL